MLPDRGGRGRVTTSFLAVAKETISICVNVLAQSLDQGHFLKPLLLT